MTVWPVSRLGANPSPEKRPMKRGEMASDEVAHTERRRAERGTGWMLAVAVFGVALVLYGAIGYAVYRIALALV